ncbi:hypothetical protein N8I77_001601 [Diaporthe amygdali]|uniref:FAM50A/XAP5 C-terminal domain-containing protein n=1 Tax=Phomopsis amygdali TaxID=1214568 RepID=A0AAD9SQZ7_PHOAM|nr:hypothetical protein N8I77_001601 [Diaporthe amygdali]
MTSSSVADTTSSRDVDAENLKHAEMNVRMNDLQSRVQVLPRKLTDLMVPLDELDLDRIDFVMTNPPFYESEEQMLKSAAAKSRPPHSACTGTPVEMVCPGGEVAFVDRILHESLQLKQRVQWYTCMFGMVSSLEVMVQKLKERGVYNYAVTEFVQGKKTRRWAVAWSFGPMRPSQVVCRGMKATPWRKILPAVVEVEVLAIGNISVVAKKADELSGLVGSLQLLSWEWDREKLSGIGRARENVWSRAWRRKRKRGEEDGPAAAHDTRGKDQWREGHDESIFTSFLCSKMSNSPTPSQAQSRFKAPNNMSTQERISTNTVGLVNLSDFRKRRAEVLEQQEREAREALRSGTTTPLIDRSQSATPSNLSDGGSERPVKKQKKPKKALVSFGDDEEDNDAGPVLKLKAKGITATDSSTTGDDQPEPSTNGDIATKDGKKPSGKILANASVGFVPRAMTKSALRREAAERDTLRKEFLALQEAVKATEIAMPFVFYDGTNIPGGTVRVKKGEFVWVFLDKSRKVGAELGVGGEKNANVRREWARVGVDDLMLVRGTMIIPHHYEFYFFIMNKTVGPGNVRLFDYSAEAPTKIPRASGSPEPPPNPLSTPAGKGGINTNLVDINTLEGADEDPAFTKVVDRRWYERNKHIYPASVWQEFDPEKDYTSEIRRDTGGNTFFFTK